MPRSTSCRMQGPQNDDYLEDISMMVQTERKRSVCLSVYLGVGGGVGGGLGQMICNKPESHHFLLKLLTITQCASHSVLWSLLPHCAVGSKGHCGSLLAYDFLMFMKFCFCYQSSIGCILRNSLGDQEHCYIFKTMLCEP